MSSPSNLYAEKIYAEHPLALWALDDRIDYLSLITEQQREISEPNWDITGISSNYTQINDTQPFKDSVNNVIEGTPNALVILKSPNLVNLSSLQDTLSTLCIGTYYYSNSDNYDYIEIGYEYIDSQTSLVVQNMKRFTTIVQDKWVFISNTFELPDEQNAFRVVIKIKLNNSGGSPSDYIFSFNGLSVGQWSEEFNATSLGVNSIDFPNSIALNTSGLKCLESNSYGSLINKGYYIVSENVLTAKNTSIPLVYGSAGVVRLLPNYKTQIDQVIDGGPAQTNTTDIIDGGIPYPTVDNIIDGGQIYDVPSYIVPGFGLLNDSGRYKEYTLEFWARIDSNAIEPKRIVGPINSRDGLYVEGGFITLVIGNNFKSYFVGQWIRPMLFDLAVDKSSASLFINGEEVISMVIDMSSTTLPLISNSQNKTQDYIGFYVYPDIPSFELDSVAIYSYKVPSIVSKRRFVYGQGVGSSELINNSYAGNEAAIDYTVAEYTSDYNYPDFAKWDQASFDNLSMNSLSLNTPSYQLPNIYFDNKTIDDFYLDNSLIQNEEYPFITLTPNSDWNNTLSYINFPRLDILQTPVKMFYITFNVKQYTSNDEIILKIYNSENSNYFKIVKNEENIKYLFNFNDIETELHSFGYSYNEKVVAGIKIDELSQQNNNIYSFFNNLSTLKMYVGGDNTGLYKFYGNIYSIGFGSDNNCASFSHFIDGIANHAQYEYFINKLSSYTLLPTKKYDKFFLDIGISGYWEDYVPLSYFGKYVDDLYNKQYYDFDFLQFNIDYPSPTTPIIEETNSEWLYLELDSEFTSPIIKTYFHLDNENYTGWQDYQDMNQNADKYKRYDISQSEVKSYITMQYILDGANLLQSNFTSIIPINENKVVDFSNHPGWINHKFEIIDGTIVYPPKNVNFDELAVVYRLEFNIRNTVNRPMSIKRLQWSSQSFDHNRFNGVGTKYGAFLYPYTKTGIYYDYKSKNPFAIYKNSTPYLYMTQNSGIELRNEYETSIDKGLSFPINSGQSSNFKMAALQFWIRSNKYNFNAVKQKLFEINYLEDSIEFYLEANSTTGDRGRIFAISKKTQQPFIALTYYINGNIVREPVISKNEWSVVGIAFDKNINFDNYLGSMNMVGPYIYNNVSYYQATNLQLAQSRILQSWSKIKTLNEVDKDWVDWLSYTWNQILILGASDLYGTNPADIYKTYIGTNKIIIDDNSGLSVDSDTLSVYQDSTWETFVTNPV